MKSPSLIKSSLLALVTLAGAALTHADIITSSGDPALTGAVIDSFSSYAIGNPLSISDGFYTMTQNGGGTLEVTDAYDGAYGAVGRSVVSWGGNGITINFADPVTAMGILIGGSNYSWSIFAYDGGLLGSGTVPSQVDGFFLGWEDSSGIGSVSFSPSGVDAVLFDDLHYVTSVPDSGTTVALFGGALIGLAALRRRILA